jgi:hypothetical protein
VAPPRRIAQARCPDPRHRRAAVSANGTYARGERRFRRYRCRPLAGDPHTFSVPIDGANAVPMSPPPPCPDHQGKVIRYGTYGTRTAKPRQRYRCTPADGSKPHVFTPTLPRDHVHAGSDSCEHCEELRGVHRGETAVARRHSWSTRVVARGLEQLSAGTSYADVSRWALRVTGNPTRRRATTTISAAQPDDGDVSRPAKRRKSAASAESHNVWHIAAGWTEVFAPVVYVHVETGLRDRALVERRRLDALAASGVSADRPQVWLLDDVPVYGRDAAGTGKSRRDAGFFVLVLAEVEWTQPGGDGGGPPVGRPRLRLVRAMAKSNKAAWRLVFDEMGYEPDFAPAPFPAH